MIDKDRFGGYNVNCLYFGILIFEFSFTIFLTIKHAFLHNEKTVETHTKRDDFLLTTFL